MRYPDLSAYAASTLRAAFATAGIPITPATETYLTVLATRTGCWKAVFAAVATWLGQASTAEAACAWQGIITVCNQDSRPLAAYSRLWAYQSNVDALVTMWQALPAGTLTTLRMALGSNPFLRDRLMDPTSGLGPVPALLSDPTSAAAIWAKVLGQMNKLSEYTGPATV
jgi:hypothetical protein